MVKKLKKFAKLNFQQQFFSFQQEKLMKNHLLNIIILYNQIY